MNTEEFEEQGRSTAAIFSLVLGEFHSSVLFHPDVKVVLVL